MTATQAKEVFEKEIQRLNQQFNFKPAGVELELHHRRGSCAGDFTGRMTSLGWTYRIRINQHYLDEMGIDRCLGTVRHEWAHMYLWDKYRIKGHPKAFKDLCASIGGTMNSMFARNHPGAVGEYLTTNHTWKYVCPGCGYEMYRSRRYTHSQALARQCSKCKTNVSQFRIYRNK